jgi:site-specific recombinase XerD
VATTLQGLFSSARSPVGCTVLSFIASLPTSPERAGLPKDKRHFHCLKHSLGVSLVEANVNLAIIKQALSHKFIASTAVYTVPTD